MIGRVCYVVSGHFPHYASRGAIGPGPQAGGPQAGGSMAESPCRGSLKCRVDRVATLAICRVGNPRPLVPLPKADMQPLMVWTPDGTSWSINEGPNGSLRTTPNYGLPHQIFGVAALREAFKQVLLEISRLQGQSFFFLRCIAFVTTCYMLTHPLDYRV